MESIASTISVFLLPTISLLTIILLFLLTKFYISYRNELTGLTQNIQKISEFQSILNKTFLDETSRNRTEILTSVNTILTSLSQKQLENLHIFSENLNQLTQMNQKSLTDINETLKSELQKLNVNT
ncbi:MAG: hypothetical protein ACP5QY_08645, partial [Candidatus Hydrogenedens sp.]